MPEKGQKREKDGQDTKHETMDPPPGTGELVKCWTMELVGTTPAALEVDAGEPITATPASNRLMVLAPRVGTLGYAPSQEAAEILAENQATGGTLSGALVSREGTTLKVELCLYRR